MIEIFNHGSLYVDRGYIAISKATLLWNISSTVKQTCLLEQGATTFQAIIMYATWLMKLELYIVWCDRSKRSCKGSNGSDLNYTEEKKKVWGLFLHHTVVLVVLVEKLRSEPWWFTCGCRNMSPESKNAMVTWSQVEDYYYYEVPSSSIKSREWAKEPKIKEKPHPQKPIWFALCFHVNRHSSMTMIVLHALILNTNHF